MKIIARFLTISALILVHAAAAPNPLESELFPPDFLLSQREALGLNETQLQDIQTMVQDVQPKFELLKSQLEERVKALQDAVHQDKPDIAQAGDKLRAMLSQENELKLMQLDFLLSLKSKLTPDQVAKARELRTQSASTGSSSSGDSIDAVRERLQPKFVQLKAAVEAQAASSVGGQPPEETLAKVHEIQQLVQNGNALEAEKKLDALLATLPPAKAKP